MCGHEIHQRNCGHETKVPVYCIKGNEAQNRMCNSNAESIEMRKYDFCRVPGCHNIGVQISPRPNTTESMQGAQQSLGQVTLDSKTFNEFDLRGRGQQQFDSAHSSPTQAKETLANIRPNPEEITYPSLRDLVLDSEEDPVQNSKAPYATPFVEAPYMFPTTASLPHPSALESGPWHAVGPGHYLGPGHSLGPWNTLEQGAPEPNLVVGHNFAPGNDVSPGSNLPPGHHLPPGIELNLHGQDLAPGNNSAPGYNLAPGHDELPTNTLAPGYRFSPRLILPAGLSVAPGILRPPRPNPPPGLQLLPALGVAPRSLYPQGHIPQQLQSYGPNLNLRGGEGSATPEASDESSPTESSPPQTHAMPRTLVETARLVQRTLSTDNLINGTLGITLSGPQSGWHENAHTRSPLQQTPAVDGAETNSPQQQEPPSEALDVPSSNGSRLPVATHQLSSIPPHLTLREVVDDLLEKPNGTTTPSPLTNQQLKILEPYVYGAEMELFRSLQCLQRRSRAMGASLGQSLEELRSVYIGPPHPLVTESKLTSEVVSVLERLRAKDYVFNSISLPRRPPPPSLQAPETSVPQPPEQNAASASSASSLDLASASSQPRSVPRPSEQSATSASSVSSFQVPAPEAYQVRILPPLALRDNSPSPPQRPPWAGLQRQEARRSRYFGHMVTYQPASMQVAQPSRNSFSPPQRQPRSGLQRQETASSLSSEQTTNINTRTSSLSLVPYPVLPDQPRSKQVAPYQPQRQLEPRPSSQRWQTSNPFRSDQTSSTTTRAGLHRGQSQTSFSSEQTNNTGTSSRPSFQVPVPEHQPRSVPQPTSGFRRHQTPSSLSQRPPSQTTIPRTSSRSSFQVPALEAHQPRSAPRQTLAEVQRLDDIERIAELQRSHVPRSAPTFGQPGPGTVPALAPPTEPHQGPAFGAGPPTPSPFLPFRRYH